MKKWMALAAFGLILVAAQGTTPAYPEGYRGWTHVKSMVVEEGHPLFGLVGGLHHIYANDKALQGYRDKKSFPEGSVIVFDLLEPVKGGNAITEGARKAVILMEKNSSRFAATGNWGYGLYQGDTKQAASIDAQSCFACHKDVAQTDFIFSAYRP
jgi:hypothetical protein